MRGGHTEIASDAPVPLFEGLDKGDGVVCTELLRTGAVAVVPSWVNGNGGWMDLHLDWSAGGKVGGLDVDALVVVAHGVHVHVGWAGGGCR